MWLLLRQGFFYGGATPVCALRQGVPLADAFPLRLLLRQDFYWVLDAPLANASPMRSKRLLLRGALCGQGAPLADASPMRLRAGCSSGECFSDAAAPLQLCEIFMATINF